MLVFTQVAYAIQAPRAIVATPQPTAKGVVTQTNVRVIPAQMHVYPTADPRASLMQPVVDRKGYVWFGEMRANKLARLDPKTGALREWDLPGRRYGFMMGAVTVHQIASHLGWLRRLMGTIWFTSDSEPNDYIGHIFP